MAFSSSSIVCKSCGIHLHVGVSYHYNNIHDFNKLPWMLVQTAFYFAWLLIDVARGRFQAHAMIMLAIVEQWSESDKLLWAILSKLCVTIYSLRLWPIFSSSGRPGPLLTISWHWPLNCNIVLPIVHLHGFVFFSCFSGCGSSAHFKYYYIFKWEIYSLRHAHCWHTCVCISLCMLSCS